MLGSLEHDTPRYDDSQLDAMLGEARKRSARFGRRRRRQQWSGAVAVALIVAVVIAVTSVASLGNDGGTRNRVIAAPRRFGSGVKRVTVILSSDFVGLVGQERAQRNPGGDRSNRQAGFPSGRRVFTSSRFCMLPEWRPATTWNFCVLS